jgi:hypothetical protein
MQTEINNYITTINNRTEIISFIHPSYNLDIVHLFTACNEHLPHATLGPVNNNLSHGFT